MTKTRKATAMKPRKWRESFTVWIDFIGNRSQIGPLLDHIAGVPSDGGGQFLALPLSDQSWTFTQTKDPLLPEARAFRCFSRIRDACKRPWSSYIRVRLLHDDKPDRCPPPQIISEKTRAGNRVVRLKHVRGRGPKVLRKYQRGKCPDLSKIVRPMRPKRRRLA